MSNLINEEVAWGCLPQNDKVYNFSFFDGTLCIYYDYNININFSKEYTLEKNVLTSTPLLLNGYLYKLGKRIVFHVNQTPINSTVAIGRNMNYYKVNWYIIYEESNISSISSMVFVNDELNYFFKSSIKNQYVLKEKNLEKVEVLLTEDLSEKFNFKIDEKEICCILNIETNIHSATIQSYSYLKLIFEATNNYEYIFNLYNLVKSFFMFICYRKNITFEQVKLLGLDVNGHSCEIANFYYIEDTIHKEDKKTVEKTIGYAYIKSHIGKIFEVINKLKVPFYNIPSNRNEYLKINYTRYLSNLSVFEWLYRLDNVEELSELRKKAKEELLVDLIKLRSEPSYTGKKKEEIKNIIQFLENSLRKPEIKSLETKITHSLDRFNAILGLFIKNYSNLNNKVYEDYSILASEISKQRNDFAHCNYDKDYSIDAMIGLTFIEWVNYVMVLKYVGFEDDECKKIINVVFNRNFAL